MIPSIQTNIQVDGGKEYLGWAQQRLAAMERSRLETGAPLLSKTLYPADGVEVYIRASATGNLIRITASGTGFVCHPRDTTNPGGAKPGGVAITPTYQYPLVDDDNGSRVLTWDDDEWQVSSDVENYGNLDWMGPDGEAVSWRGPAGRQFAMDRLLSFPGFTEWDGADLNNDYYTPYRNLVYQGGEVVREFLYGYKVLGAAMAGGALVCVVGVDYAGIENPDGGTGGFYDEVYVWDARIGWQATSRPSVPWFFDSTGRMAVCGNRKLTIAEDLASVSFESLESGSGLQSNTCDPNDKSFWSISRNGSWPMYRDYNGEVMQGVLIQAQGLHTTSRTSTSGQASSEFPIMISGVHHNAVVVSGPEDYAGEGAYTYTLAGGTGNCPIDSVEWSYPSGCGMGVVSVTVLLESGNILSGSMDVRMPVGRWVQVNRTQYDDCNIPYPSRNIYHTSGKYLYQGFGQCYSPDSWQNNYPLCQLWPYAYADSWMDLECPAWPQQCIPSYNSCFLMRSLYVYEWVCP